MPQGYITRVEKDFGWVTTDGGRSERPFRHWALAPEMAGRFPAPGAYVQFMERQDSTRGWYIADVRALTPPAQPAVQPGRTKNVYQDAPKPHAGIERVLHGERLPLQVALEEEARQAAQPAKPVPGNVYQDQPGQAVGVQRLTNRPTVQHQPVADDWEVP